MLRSFTHLLIVPLLLLMATSTAVLGEDEAAAPDEGAATAATVEDLSQEAPAEEEAASESGFIQQIRNGGVPMGFLVALALVGIGLILERLARLTRSNIAPDGLAEEANSLWQNGDHDGVAKLAKSNTSALARVLAFLVENRDADYVALNEGAGEIAAREIQKQQQMNYWLAVVATLSPLLGLLGTVLGMISAFETVALAGDIGDTSMVAEGIYMALSTTAAGLIIAIPALGFFHFLKGRASQLALDLEDASSHLIITWFGKGAGKEA